MKKYILFLILIILFLVPLSVLATDEMEYRIDILQCGKDIRFDGQYFYVETKDEKLVILNTKMEQIIGPVYNYTTRNFSEGMLIVSQTTEESGEKQTRYGAIDLNGNLKIDFLFSQLYDFENGKAQGLLGENAVFVDRTGNIIRDFGKHGYFGKFVNGYAFVRDELIDGKSFFGEQLTFYYDLIGNPTSSECEAVTGKAEKLYPDTLNGYYFIDETGDVIISGLTANVTLESGLIHDVDCNECIGSVTLNPSVFTAGGIAIVTKDYRDGIIDKSGKVIFDFCMRDYTVLGDRIFGILDKKNNMVVFDQYGNKLYENNYIYYLYDGSKSSDNTKFIVRRDRAYGVVSDTNEVLVPFEYNWIQPANKDFDVFIVTRDGKKGMINIKNDILVPLEYSVDDFLALEDDFNVIYTKKNGKFGIIDRNNNILVPFEYQFIKGERDYSRDTKDKIFSKSGLAVGRKEEHDFLINVRDKKILAEYEHIKALTDELFCVESDGKKGLINTKGELLVPPEYEYMSISRTPGTITAKKGGKFGLINLKNDILIPFDYYTLESMGLCNGIFIGCLNGKYGVIDINNKIIVPFECTDYSDAESKLNQLVESGAIPVPAKVATRVDSLDKNFIIAYYESTPKTKKYYDKFDNLIFIVDNGKTYDKKNNLIANYDITRNITIFKLGLNIYWSGYKGFDMGLIAVNQIPKPQTGTYGKYICLMMNNPLININGETKLLEDSDYFFVPLVENDHTLIPLRVIFEAMNADVEWNEETQTVTAIQGKTTIKFSIGKNEMYVNDKVICLDAPVRISNGRTFIPLRAVAEAFDAKVDWNEDLKLITITY